jgi:hypothetical protein
MRCCLRVAALAALSSLCALGATNGYTFTQFSYPNAYSTVPKAMNSSGQIVGFYELTAPCCQWFQYRNWHGFLKENNIFTSIDVPGANWTAALNLDDNGHVFGVYRSSETGSESPFTYDIQTGAFTLPTFSWFAVTYEYQVAAMSPTGILADQTYDGTFVYSNGTSGPITIPKNTSFVPAGINAKGEIAGTLYSSSAQPVLYSRA